MKFRQKGKEIEEDSWTRKMHGVMEMTKCFYSHLSRPHPTSESSFPHLEFAFRISVVDSSTAEEGTPAE